MKSQISPDPHSPNYAYDQALRALDPATETLSSTQQKRSQDILNAVLRAESGGLERFQMSSVKPTRVPIWRWIVVPVVAATAIGVVVIGGIGSDSTAYAGWSATPTPLDPADAVLAGEECHDMLTEILDPEVGHPSEDEMKSLEPQLSESRGPWTFTLMTSGKNIQGACFMPSETIDGISAGFEQDNTFGGIATTDVPLELQGDEIETFFGGTGSTDEGLFGYLTGRVGDNVKAVRITTPGQSIDASVIDGHWAAWWPTGSQNRDDPGILQTKLQVTLKDGTVLDQ